MKIPSLYFAHKRRVFERDNLIWAAHDDFVYRENRIDDKRSEAAMEERK